MNKENNDTNEILKKEYKSNKKIPITLSIIIMVLQLPFLYDMLFVEHTGAFDLSGVGDLLIIILGTFAILGIWFIFSIAQTIKKSKNKEKSWWKPLVAAIIIFLVPHIAIEIFDTITALNGNKEAFTDAEPEIVSYENIDDIPIIEGYKILGTDINGKDVYENVKKYKNQKVLVKGRASSFTTASGTHGERADFSISGEGLIYQFTFIDRNSEFAHDNYIFFSNSEMSTIDYYAYTYGTIVSVQEGYDGTKAINIKPEKIYYTLNWNSVLEEKDIVYSECAKEGKQCTQEEILSGQIVNVAVNENESLDFYILKDDGNKLTLYTHKALGEIEYLSLDDKNKLEKDNNSSNDIFGPYTLMKEINEITKTWTNIEPINNFSYYTNTEDSYNNITINNGNTVITTKQNKLISVPGKTVARPLVNEDFLRKYELPDFIGKPCLLKTEPHHHHYCFISTLESHKYTKEISQTIHARLNELEIEVNYENESIHDKGFIVPVIEISKSKINTK